MPFRVYYTAQAGFDTHAGQRYTHQDLLRQVSQARAGFLKSLKTSRLDERVVVLLFSEFGRRLKENASERDRPRRRGSGALGRQAGQGRPDRRRRPTSPCSTTAATPASRPTSATSTPPCSAAGWTVDPEPILGRREGTPALFESGRG